MLYAVANSMNKAPSEGIIKAVSACILSRRRTSYY